MDIHSITVADVMHEVIKIGMDVSLHDILFIINWNTTASIVIVNEQDHTPFGILTKNDINNARKKKINFHSTHAWEICSGKLLSIPHDALLIDAHNLMINNNIHHLLVMMDKNIAGVITANDVEDPTQ